MLRLPFKLEFTSESYRFRSALELTALTALALWLFFWRVGDRALWSSHEGRAGQHAQLMIDSGHWGMPTLYFGEADYQKPPLYYWLVAGMAKLRGGVVDAWAVRFPAAATAVAGVWAVYLAGSALGRRGVAIIAALILLSNIRYSWLARVGRIDMPMGIAVTIALLSFYVAYSQFSSADRADLRKVRRWMLASYLATAIAVLLKGPVGLVLVVLPVLVFLSWERQPVWPWKHGFGELMRRLGAWWGIPLWFAIACPWFVWATVTTQGAFFKSFFLHHHWDRTLGVQGLKPEPFWYYLPEIAGDLFPWSLLLPAALVWQLRGAGSERDRFGRFTFCWVVTMFGFLSLVRFKRHDYLLPIIPGVALFLASNWARLFAEGWSVRNRRRVAGFCTAWLVALVVFAVGLLMIRNDRMLGLFDFESWAKRLFHETDEMLAGELLRAIVPLRSILAVTAAFAVLLAGCALWLALERRAAAAVITIAGGWTALFAVYIHGVLPMLEPIREQQTIAAALRELQPAAENLYYYGREDQQLMFYLGPQARWLPDRTALRPVIAQSDPALVIMELDRFQQRQKDWPTVEMLPVLSNTSNRFGIHQNPAVIVTNSAAARIVRQSSGIDVHAN